MTDPTEPPTDDDVSASLDGEADPDLQARIEADPAARARRDQLRKVAEAVAAPVAPLAPHVVDRLVASALDAGAVTGGEDPGDTGSGGLPPARPGRRPPPRWLVAAAVVLLTAVGLTLVWSGRDRDRVDDVALRDATASTEESTAGSAAPAADGSRSGTTDATDATARDEAGTTGHGGVPSTTSGAEAGTTAESTDIGLVDLGRFETVDDLRTALATTFTATDGGGSDGDDVRPEAVQRCADQVRITLSLDDGPTAQGVAVVDGETLLVYEYATATDDGQPTTLIAAVDVATCQPDLLFQR